MAFSKLDGKGIDLSSNVLTSFASTGIDDNASSTALTIDSSGKVGIGTSNPDTKLHISGGINSGPATAGSTDAALIVSNADDAYGIHMNVNGSTGAGYISSQRNDGTATTYNLILQPNGGRVGIRTETPVATLCIKGPGSTDSELDIEGNSGGATLECINRTDTNAGQTLGLYSRNGAITFNTGTYTEAMRVESTGHLEIGGTPLYSNSSTLNIKDSSITDYGDEANAETAWNSGSHSQIKVDAGNNTLVIGVDADTNARSAWIQGGHGAESYAAYGAYLHLNPLGTYNSFVTKKTQPYIWAKVSSNQSISSGTWTKVALNATPQTQGYISWDSTNYRYTITAAGLYHFTLAVNFGTSSGTNGYMYTAIAVNGGLNYMAGIRTPDGQLNDTQLTASWMRILSTSDYIELWAYNGAGGTIVGNNRTWLQAYFLG